MSSEVQRPPIDPAHGEKVDERTGKIIVARLPVRTRPCWAQPTSTGQHTDCAYCSGTGQIAIKEPKETAVDAADDGLSALIDALAERDDNGNRVDSLLGDSIENLMKRSNVTLGGSSNKGGSKKKQPKKRVWGESVPPVEYTDGQKEYGHIPNTAEVAHEIAREKELQAREEAGERHVRRGGRKARFKESRPERLSTSVDFRTKDGLVELNTDLAALINAIMDSPESKSVLLEAKATIAKTSYETALKEAAMQELRMRSGEVPIGRGGITRVRARIKRCYTQMLEAQALAAQ